MYAKASTCDIKQEILQLNGSSKAKIRKASRYLKSYTYVYSYNMYLYVIRENIDQIIYFDYKLYT